MKGVVSVAVADLRREPQELFPRNFAHHPLRESQLLYGERIHILEQWNEWLHVEALEQEKFSPGRGWHGYPGWVHQSEIAFVENPPEPNCAVCASWVSLFFTPLYLSFGTLLHQISPGIVLLPTGETASCDPSALRLFPQNLSRKTLFNDASLFLGFSYLWGGRASLGKNSISSVDCSGLVNLVYRAQGIHIPRDAHDQFLKGSQIDSKDLQIGDAIYLAREGKPERMTHVVLYTGSSTCIESPESGKKVRRLSILSPLSNTIFLEGRPHAYHAHYCTL